jgi:hypothetical protein
MKASEVTAEFNQLPVTGAFVRFPDQKPGSINIEWATKRGVARFVFKDGNGHVEVEVDGTVFITKPVALSRLDSQAPPKYRRWLADNLPALVRDSQSMTLAKDENRRHRWYAEFRLAPLGGATPYLKICVDLVGDSASWSVEYTWRQECLLHEIRVQTRYIPLRRLGYA